MKKKEKELRHTTDFVYKESFSQELFWFETEWEKISAPIKRKNSEEDKDIPAKRPRDPETSRLSYCRYNQEVFVIIMTSWPVHQGLISPCSLESLQTANTSQYVWLTFMRAQLTREVILIQPNEHLNINFISVRCTYTVIISLLLWHTGFTVQYVSIWQTNPSGCDRRERERGGTDNFTSWRLQCWNFSFLLGERSLFLTRRLLCVCCPLLSPSFSNLLEIW